jgi:molybdopterin converting factor small subunit
VKVPVTVPGLLAESVGGRRKIEVAAQTLEEALRALREAYPGLRTHVWDESGNIRQHVLVYLNDESIAWIDDPASHRLREGDELFIIQAVSGG